MRIEGINNLFSSKELANRVKQEEGFSSILKDFIADVNSDLHKATKAQQTLMSGKVDNIAELMVTIEKADISLRFATELRNKALEAYQEIMRMQV